MRSRAGRLSRHVSGRRPDRHVQPSDLASHRAGGRISAVAGVPGDPHVYYAASASGGLAKSTDGGVTWEQIFDDQPVHAIGEIAVAPSDPNTIFGKELKRLNEFMRGRGVANIVLPKATTQ